MYQVPYQLQYDNHNQNTLQRSEINDETPFLKYVIILIMIVISIIFAVNISEISMIFGEWQSGGMNAAGLTIKKNEDKPGFLKAIGRFADGDIPFLAYGRYPFLYQVSLYPIGSILPAYKIRFIPLPLTGEYELELEKIGGTIVTYKRSGDVSSE